MHSSAAAATIPFRIAGAGHPPCCCCCSQERKSNAAKLCTEYRREWPAVSLRKELFRCREATRHLVESIPITRQGGGNKELISLGLGDPGAAAAEFRVPPHAAAAVAASVASFKFNGYTHSAGSINCRSAVADYLSADLPSEPVSPADVFITPGCSQALVYCILALSKPGCNILIPRPAFPIYESICVLQSVETRGYELIPERGWEANLSQMEQRADSRTVAIIVCNPSNPCGSVYSYRHLEEISQLAKRLRVPIVSDEIYAKMVFGGNTFVPMASFSRNAPVFTVGGLSKRWFAPGWRLGWACLSDPLGVYKRAGIQQALLNIAQINLGTSSIIQETVPTILSGTPQDYFDKVLRSLEQASKLCFTQANSIRELSCPYETKGAMYVMVKIKIQQLWGIANDTDFCKSLLEEENVIVVPGSGFGYPDWFRIQLAVPLPSLRDAWSRIRSFCSRHSLQALN